MKIIETREIIRILRNGEEIDQAMVANRLEWLVKMIDDMHNDHYVDYLEWYMNRCWDLEEELHILTKGGCSCGIN